MPESILTAFGKQLRYLRHQKGYSQEQLAELAALHRTYLGGVERGDRNPTLVSLWRIALALDITLSDLVDFAPDEATTGESVSDYSAQ